MLLPFDLFEIRLRPNFNGGHFNRRMRLDLQTAIEVTSQFFQGIDRDDLQPGDEGSFVASTSGTTTISGKNDSNIHILCL
jgi:hypothetical protein